MLKTRPILTLLLTLALLLQGYGEVRANEIDCCSDDCSQKITFCLMMTTGGNCATCQTAAMSPYVLNATATTGKNVAMHSNVVKIYSAEMHNIWRPPIAV